MEVMYVKKRNGVEEKVVFDKISTRIQKLCFGLNTDYVDHIPIAQKVIQGIYPGVTTRELDDLAAQTSAYMAINHPDFSLLAGRISVSNLHKSTKESFSETMNDLYTYGVLADDISDIIKENSDVLDSAMDYEKDFKYEYFGFKTLEKSYLLRINGEIVERPQHMLMRVAVGIHKGDMASVLETYNDLSDKRYTHATPTLFNAGTRKNQLSSCYLLPMQEDSIDGIYDTLKSCAQISKYAGGIGVSVSNIRAAGAYIKGTNGIGSGLTPMLKVFNETARYVNQAGRRKGSFAMYIEPHHGDIMDFLDLKKNHGNEMERARDLFYALWIPDIFMRRVQADANWTLMCPSKTPDLVDLYGEDFDEAYTAYESSGIGKTIKARVLWSKIIESQIETGTPYMLYKDACNKKSNQKNLGTIRSSNLCAEIIQYSSKDEIAVCNLASINLVHHVTEDKAFDFEKLHDTAKKITRNLNKVIDVNFYPLDKTRESNFKHRPMGMGVQALADTFMVMGLPFDSKEAGELNACIFETIYHGAVEASIELAKIHGPYESYEGSPASKGLFQFDLWNKVVDDSRHNWTKTRADMAKYGLFNSLLIAQMPCASSATFCSGGVESIEAQTANIFNRRTLSGEFPVINRHLVNDLINLGIWDSEMKNAIVGGGGSVQHISSIPSNIRSIYKTSWEIKQKIMLDQAISRGPFVCQSASQNVFFESPTVSKLSTYHLYGWRNGLKTGMYYCRTKPVRDALKFTVTPGSPDLKKRVVGNVEDDVCIGCSA
ncbi:unnamed protein product [Pylaiella littoralis]